jgi:hypothetical protein
MLFVGLDLGQRKDFTAVAVVERKMGRLHNAAARPTLLVRHLERVALGTAYTRVVERVCGMRHPALELPRSGGFRGEICCWGWNCCWSPGS